MIIELDKNDLEKVEELNKTFSNIINSVQSDFENNPFTHYLVYLDKRKIVGYLNYYLMYDRIEIANFNVLEGYQNKGFGTSLLNYLIGKYDNNIKNITLEVRSDNIKAINLYKKMGFIKKAIRKNYYKDTDGILMERKVM